MEEEKKPYELVTVPVGERPKKKWVWVVAAILISAIMTVVAMSFVSSPDSVPGEQSITEDEYFARLASVMSRGAYSLDRYSSAMHSFDVDAMAREVDIMENLWGEAVDTPIPCEKYQSLHSNVRITLFSYARSMLKGTEGLERLDANMIKEAAEDMHTATSFLQIAQTQLETLQLTLPNC